MLSSSPSKIHEPLVTGVSPRPTDQRQRQKTAKHELTREVGPGRPAGVSTGGFPRAASRTRRARFRATGAPQVPLWVGRPKGAAWPESPVLVAPPETARAPIRRYSPATTSGHPSILPADLLAPFAMCTPLACSDYYGASAPSRGHRSATDLPTSRAGCPVGRATGDGSHVHHGIDR